MQMASLGTYLDMYKILYQNTRLFKFSFLGFYQFAVLILRLIQEFGNITTLYIISAFSIHV